MQRTWWEPYASHCCSARRPGSPPPGSPWPSRGISRAWVGIGLWRESQVPIRTRDGQGANFPIYIHCNSGKHRAPTMCMALIKTRQRLQLTLVAFDKSSIIADFPKYFTSLVINWSEWYFSDLCTCPPKVLMLGVLFNHFCTSHPCPHRQGTDRDCAERTRGCRTEAQCPPCTSLPFSHARDASKANVPPGGTQQGKHQKTSKNFQTSKKNFQTSKNFQSQAKETQLLGSWWSRSAGFWRRATWHTRLHRPRRTH